MSSSMYKNKNIKKMQDNIDRIISKIDKCVNYDMLYCLEEDFNDIGMTLQPAKKNQMLLCTVVDGVPTARRIFEDYIHVGSVENGSNEVPVRLLECIKDFVIENARLPSTPLNSTRASQWKTSQNKVYGKFVVEESIKKIINDVQDDPKIKSLPASKKRVITEKLDPNKIAEIID